MAFTHPERGGKLYGVCILTINNFLQTDMVAVFGETTGYYALQYMMERMSQDPMGRKILK